jgi:hypothetical protein
MPLWMIVQRSLTRWVLIVPLLERDEEKRGAAFRRHLAANYWTLSRL